MERIKKEKKQLKIFLKNLKYRKVSDGLEFSNLEYNVYRPEADSELEGIGMYSVFFDRKDRVKNVDFL